MSKGLAWVQPWRLTAILLGLIVGALFVAPASWLDQIANRSSGGLVRVANTSGSLWSGQGLLILKSPQAQSFQTTGIRLSWILRPSVWPLGLSAQIKGNSLAWQDPSAAIEWSLLGGMNIPAGRLALEKLDLSGLPAPLGIAKLSTMASLRWPDLSLGANEPPRLAKALAPSAAESPPQTGTKEVGPSLAIELRLIEVSSGLAPIKPLGNYLLTLALDANGPQSWRIQDQNDAVVAIQAQGLFADGSIQGRLECRRFCDHLQGLLNLIGKKDGESYVFTHKAQAQ